MKCSTGKMRFASRQQAEEAAQKSANSSGRKIKVYPCPRCKGWHRSSKGRFTGSGWFRPSKGSKEDNGNG